MTVIDERLRVRAISARAPHAGVAGLRCRLKPVHAMRGHVQGGWWPRTDVLLRELPPLLDALFERHGDVESVRYHPQDWSAAPRIIEHLGGPVRIEPSAEAPHVVTVTGAHGWRLTLLVVSPYTDPDEAYEIVTAAAAADTATPEHPIDGDHRGTRRDREFQRALLRWESDGGAAP